MQFPYQPPNRVGNGNVGREELPLLPLALLPFFLLVALWGDTDLVDAVRKLRSTLVARLDHGKFRRTNP